MNIFKISLVGLGVVAVVGGCGSGDGGGHPNTAKLAACPKKMDQVTNPVCDKCIADKCAANQKKCTGEDLNGGPCQRYWACRLNSPDLCAITPDCVQSADCVACQKEGSSCVAACSSVCTSSVGGLGGSGAGGDMGAGNSPGIGGRNGGPGTGTGGFGTGTGGFGTGTGATGSTGGGSCAELNSCCKRITEPNLKSACDDSYSAAMGDDSFCSMLLDIVIDFC